MMLCSIRGSTSFVQLKDHIYSLKPEASLSIGKRSLGHVSNYYLGEIISDSDVEAIQAAAEKLGVDVLNTRFVSLARLMIRFLVDMSAI
jgi:dipeptidyl-peptidase III